MLNLKDFKLKPFLSIITVCFNSQETIRETINSVLNQTFKNFEYLIIDGKSTDKTLEIIREFNDKRIILISENDLGIFDAMNKGIKISQGEWIHILNSDDCYFSKNSLSLATEVLDKKKTNYFQMCFKNKNNKIYKKYSWDYFRPKLYLKACIPHPSMIISSDQYREVGLYDLRYKITSDHDFTLKLVKKFPGKNNNFVLVSKLDGGITHKNKKEVIDEFRKILINNNVPKFIVNFIYIIKILNLNLKIYFLKNL